MTILIIVVTRLIVSGIALVIAARHKFNYLAIGIAMMFALTVLEFFGIYSDIVSGLARALFWLFVVIHVSMNRKHADDIQSLKELLRQLRR